MGFTVTATRAIDPSSEFPALSRTAFRWRRCRPELVRKARAAPVDPEPPHASGSSLPLIRVPTRLAEASSWLLCNVAVGHTEGKSDLIGAGSFSIRDRYR
jgi:hypothetical protein